VSAVEEETRAPAPRRGRAAAALMVLLGSLTAFGPLSLDMYLPALPQIADGFDVRDAQVQLSLTTCLVGMALGQLIGGPLSDRWGRRRPVIAGTLAYAAASLSCAVAPTAEALAGVRLVQGLAGGVGVVVARAVVRDLYAGRDAARYFSRLTLVFGLAPIAAPAMGSAVLGVTSWRGIFVVLAGIGVLLALGSARVLPETLPAGRRSPRGIRNLLGGARQVLRDRPYLGYAATQGLAFAALFAYIAGSSFVLQDVFGLSAGAYAVVFGVNALGLVVVGQLNARLLDRYSPRRLLITALCVAVTAGGLLIVAAARESLPGMLGALFLFVSTISMILPNGTALALDRHGRRAGTAAALLGFAQAVIAAAAAPLVGLGGEGSATPMAAAITAGAGLSLLAVLTLARHRAGRHRKTDHFAMEVTRHAA
jgi:DHA1 family bicyclomycin/chloramphenicol resistance-like MFS transporter